MAAAVEIAVADGFHDVLLADLDAGFEVGDGVWHMENKALRTKITFNLKF